jgi:flagellar biosynthesis chaperone FliJ
MFCTFIVLKIHWLLFFFQLRRSLSTAQDAYSKARAAAEYAAAKNWLKAIRAQITHIEEQLLEATKDGWSAERVHTLKLRLNRAQAALQKATSSVVDASNRMLEVARAAAAKLQLQLKDTLKMFDGQMDQPTTQQIVKSLRERVKKANKQVDAAKEVADKAQQRLIKQRGMSLLFQLCFFLGRIVFTQMLTLLQLPIWPVCAPISLSRRVSCASTCCVRSSTPR